MFITALFLIARTQHKYPLTDKHKQNWYIHIMKYYLAIKRNEALINTTM